MRFVLRLALPVVILGAGVAIWHHLVATKPEAKRTDRRDQGVVVEVKRVKKERQRVSVRAYGTVMPARQVVLSPEVTGRVRDVNPRLVPGGRLDAGDWVVRIDAKDYKLAVEQQYAAIERAQTELQVEQGRKEIAEKEWKLMGGERLEDASSLALRDPQLRTAKVALQSAASGLRRAKINVRRTTVRAPFNAVVREKLVDEGQLVGPQTSVAVLVGTDAFWVKLTLPVERLPWIDIPGINGVEKGSSAVVWKEIGGTRVERAATVIRLIPHLDPRGRMAQLLLAIPDPLRLNQEPTPTAVGEQAGAAAALPLFIDDFVQVDIIGHEVEQVVEIPRAALREGDFAYVMRAEERPLPAFAKDMLFWARPGEMKELRTLYTLEIRPVTVIWRLPDSVLLGAGLEDGQLLITSPVPVPVEGMKLRSASWPEPLKAER